MIERRTFLQTAAAPFLAPGGWSLDRAVREMHPFAPERVIVLSHKPDCPVERRVRQQILTEIVSKQESLSCDPVVCAHLVRVAFRLANAYDVGERAVQWASIATKLHMMGANYFRKGLGCVPNLQGVCPDARVQVMNEPVDWWLVVVPQGFTTEGYLGESKRFHVLLAHIYAIPENRKKWFGVVELLQRFLAGMDRMYGEHQCALWSDVANMKPTEACCYMNRAFIEMMSRGPDSSSQSRPERAK